MSGVGKSESGDVAVLATIRQTLPFSGVFRQFRYIN
jgi:hypothetical protein